MSKILSTLERLPNKEHTFNHDGQIKEFLLALGLETSFTRSPSKPGPTVQLLQHAYHKTHFIMVTLHLGYDDPKRNGYEAVCLPKTKYSPHDCQRFVKELTARISNGEILESGIKWSRPPGHSAN